MSADELKPRNGSSIRAHGLAGLCTDSVPLFDVPQRNFGRAPWPSINEVTGLLWQCFGNRHTCEVLKRLNKWIASVLTPGTKMSGYKDSVLS